MMQDGAVVDTVGGDIALNASSGDITLGQLITTGAASLHSGGAILDGGDTGGEDIQAESLEMTSVNGIGNGNPIDTLVAYLAAHNASTGLIDISETDGLTIGTVGGTTGIINDALNGNIHIYTNMGDLNVENSITANGGDIILTTVDSITQATATTIASNGGFINILADTDDDGVGGISQSGSASIESDGGDILLKAGTLNGGEDILLTMVNAGTGAAWIYTYGGTIIDNDTGTDTVDVVAGNDSGLYAGGGVIGWEYNPSDNSWSRDPLDVDITNGDLYVYASEKAHPYPISVDINGRVSPSNTLKLADEWGVPPGLLIFNNMIVGAGNIEDYYRATTADIMDENFEFSRFSVILLDSITDDYIHEPLDEDDAPTRMKRKWWSFITR